jgi:RHS repeat-associated protein
MLATGQAAAGLPINDVQPLRRRRTAVRLAPAFPPFETASLFAQKPHQGVAREKPAPHQGQAVGNSTTALGVSWCSWSGTAPGARDTYDYDAWGNIVSQTGSTPNVYLYRGEQYDPDLQLYYLRARYFNPLTGRFLTRDPVDGKIWLPQTLHKYLYAAGNPINAVDPSGRANIIDTAIMWAHQISWYAYQGAAAATGALAFVARICPVFGKLDYFLQLGFGIAKGLNVEVYNADDLEDFINTFCKSMGF